MGKTIILILITIGILGWVVLRIKGVKALLKSWNSGDDNK